MIEKIIYEWINNRLDVPVYLELPDRMPKRFIVFEKTSSGRRNHINSATFAFQSYATSLFGAAELNEKLKEAVESLIESPSIMKVSLNADYNFTDIELERYRYQAIYDLKY